MSNSTTIKPTCRCGYKLFRYRKIGKGRLLKCYIPRITADYVGVENLRVGDEPKCPECSSTIGRVIIVRSMLTIKLKQSTIMPMRTG